MCVSCHTGLHPSNALSCFGPYGIDFHDIPSTAKINFKSLESSPESSVVWNCNALQSCGRHFLKVNPLFLALRKSIIRITEPNVLTLHIGVILLISLRDKWQCVEHKWIHVSCFYFQSCLIYAICACCDLLQFFLNWTINVMNCIKSKFIHSTHMREYNVSVTER